MDRSQDDYRRRLEAAGYADTRLTVEPTGTVVSLGRDDAVPAELPQLIGGDRSELAFEGELGSGGMGVVLAARQLPLARQVAVKSAVRGSQLRHEAAGALVREGRITGALEHPNIVPVHALGTSDRGDVLLVMKRIEGRSWMDVLRARPALDHELERHLDILMDVCTAVHFAHSRGVIHRDLKPQNVMVGSFGEVYVLDWGLALPLADRSLAGVVSPLVAGIAGTPQFMAPEMTLPDGLLDERTDTYLLGGILHVILTGRPPHDGTTMLEVLHRAHLAEPVQLGPEVPGELAQICTRALAREPAARFASAEQLRQAIADFIHHASARELSARARQPLAELVALVAADREDDLAAHRAFSAARFGFEAAARAWSASPDARAGLRDALTAMARYELKRRHLDAASVLVGQLDEPPRELVDALAALRRDVDDAAARQAHAEQAARDADLTPTQRRRAIAFLVGGIAWAAFGVTNGVLLRAGLHTPTYLELSIGNGVMAVLLLGAWRWLVPRGMNRANRALLETTAVILATVTLLWLLVWKIHAPMAVGLGMAQALIAAVGWSFFAFFDRLFRWPALVGFLTVPVMIWQDRWAFDLNGIVVGSALVLLAWRWRA